MEEGEEGSLRPLLLLLLLGAVDLLLVLVLVAGVCSEDEGDLEVEEEEVEKIRPKKPLIKEVVGTHNQSVSQCAGETPVD